MGNSKIVKQLLCGISIASAIQAMDGVPIPVKASQYPEGHIQKIVPTNTSCGRPDQPAHSEVHYIIDENRAVHAVYQCKEGYLLDGDSLKTCGKDGKWSGTQLKCERKANHPSSVQPEIGQYTSMYFTSTPSIEKTTSEKSGTETIIDSNADAIERNELLDNTTGATNLATMGIINYVAVVTTLSFVVLLILLGIHLYKCIHLKQQHQLVKNDEEMAVNLT